MQWETPLQREISLVSYEGQLLLGFQNVTCVCCFLKIAGLKESACKEAYFGVVYFAPLQVPARSRETKYSPRPIGLYSPVGEGGRSITQSTVAEWEEATVLM